MVLAFVFKSCLHMSIQREQNKVMLFKSLNWWTVHVNTVPVGRIYHLFQAATPPGVCPWQRSSDSLVVAAGATLSHCIDLALPEWQSGVLTPSIAQHYRVVGPFASEFMARAGATGSPWEKWSLCQMCLLPHWPPTTSLLRGEGPHLHAQYLVPPWQTHCRPDPHSKFTLNFSAF